MTKLRTLKIFPKCRQVFSPNQVSSPKCLTISRERIQNTYTSVISTPQCPFSILEVSLFWEENTILVIKTIKPCQIPSTSHFHRAILSILILTDPWIRTTDFSNLPDPQPIFLPPQGPVFPPPANQAPFVHLAPAQASENTRSNSSSSEIDLLDLPQPVPAMQSPPSSRRVSLESRMRFLYDNPYFKPSIGTSAGNDHSMFE